MMVIFPWIMDFGLSSFLLRMFLVTYTRVLLTIHPNLESTTLIFAKPCHLLHLIWWCLLQLIYVSVTILLILLVISFRCVYLMLLTPFSIILAVDGGEVAAQLFSNCRTKLVSMHHLKNTYQPSLLGAFQDYVHWHGAFKELVADNTTIHDSSLFKKYIYDLWIWIW